LPVRQAPGRSQMQPALLPALSTKVEQALERSRSTSIQTFGGGCCELFRLMQLVAQGFHDKTDYRIGNRIRR
jgi:hypothetical protein